MLTIDNLKNCFNTAINNNYKYVGVLIKMPNTEIPELIVNMYDNFNYKLNYYKNTYDEQLTHKYVPKIKIIGFTHSDSLSELETLLLK